MTNNTCRHALARLPHQIEYSTAVHPENDYSAETGSTWPTFGTVSAEHDSIAADARTVLRFSRAALRRAHFNHFAYPCKSVHAVECSEAGGDDMAAATTSTTTKMIIMMMLTSWGELSQLAMATLQMEYIVDNCVCILLLSGKIMNGQ